MTPIALFYATNSTHVPTNVKFAAGGWGQEEGSPGSLPPTVVSHMGKLTEQTPVFHGDKVKPRGSGSDTGSHLCLN